MELVCASKSPPLYLQKGPFAPRDKTISDRIWNVISLIIFPIGIAKVGCHLIGKHIFSKFVLASSSEYIQKRHNHKNSIEDATKKLGDHDGVTIAKLNYRLDGVKITKSSNQKWLVYILPNGAIWQQLLESTLIPLAKNTHRNVLCVNYRATGGNVGKTERPSSFDDLYNDVYGAVQTQDLGDDPVFMGHSLGAATALKFQAKVVVQNTFSNLEFLAESRRDHLVSDTKRKLDQSLSDQKAHPIKYAIYDTFFSLPHLCIRTTYFAISLIFDLSCANFKSGASDLLEIGKTILIDLILTVSGIASLLFSSYTSKINYFNIELKNHYTIKSALIDFINRPTFIYLAKKILKCTGWYADNAKMAKTFNKDSIYIFQAPNDDKLAHEHSLAHALEGSEYVIHGKTLDLKEEKLHDYLASPHLNRHEPDRELAQFLQ